MEEVVENATGVMIRTNVEELKGVIINTGKIFVQRDSECQETSGF